MKIKRFKLYPAFIAAFFCACCLCGTGIQKIKIPLKDYNVLLITIDTLRYDRLGLYSDKYVKTPNIDRLAEKSIVFTRAFSHNPCTLPAHTNILTGTTALYHGISENSGFHLDKRYLTLTTYLKQAGYSSGAFIGAFPLDSRFGLNQGFDVYDDKYGTHNELELFFVERSAEKVIAPAVQWLSERKGKWFGWIHIFDPHQPYLPPEPYRKEYKNDLYSGEVAYVDASLKVLFDYLEERKWMNNTIIIFTADHGEALNEKGEETHSYFAYNNTIHIPLILYIPGGGSAFVRENVSHIDIFPTVCNLLGLKTPPHIQGESLLPIIEGGKRKRRDIYFESMTGYLNRGWAPLRGFIRGDMKYIDLPITEVYNIKDDPTELTNIASRSNVEQMKRDLVKLKIDLKGPTPVERSKEIDPEVSNKLKSLGYLTNAAPTAPNKVFTAADDLKTMLPLQSKMLDALSKYQTGHPKEAIDLLKSIMNASPGFVLVYSHISTIYQDSGQKEKAVEILEYGLKKNPGDIRLMSKLGILLAESNNPDRAVELLTYCIREESFNPDNFNFLGVAYYRKGDFARALENYRKTLELTPGFAPAYNNIGALYLVVYSRNLDEKAYRWAKESFDLALEIDPRLYSAYNGRGAAYMYKKNLDSAIADFKKALELKPDFIEVYLNIGIAYIKKGDKGSALKYYNRLKENYSSKLSVNERARLNKLINEAGNGN